MNYTPIIGALVIASLVWAFFNIVIPRVFYFPPPLPAPLPTAPWNPEEDWPKLDLAQKEAILARIRKVGITPIHHGGSIYNGNTNLHLR
jgi:hypothetical protein